MTRCGYGPTWKMQLHSRTWGSLERRGMRDLTTHTTHVGNQQGVYGIRCRRKILKAGALGQEKVRKFTQYP